MKRLQKRCLYKHKIQHSNSLSIRGNISIISLGSSRIIREQFECCRVILRRELKKKNLIFIRPEFSIPITSKPTGVRMGKGKGDVERFIGFCHKYDTLIELSNISINLGMKLAKKISYKLPVRIGLYTSKGELYKI